MKLALRSCHSFPPTWHHCSPMVSCVHAKLLQSCSTLCTDLMDHRSGRQAPLSMGFSRQEYWSALLCSPPGDLPDPGIKPALFMATCIGRRVLYHQHHPGWVHPILAQVKALSKSLPDPLTSWNSMQFLLFGAKHCSQEATVMNYLCQNVNAYWGDRATPLSGQGWGFSTGLGQEGS